MKKVAWAMAAMILLSAASAARADVPAVETEYGSLVLSANLQAGFSYYIGDEIYGTKVIKDIAGNILDVLPQAQDRKSDYSFYLTRFRFIAKGWVLADKISYYTETEFAGRQSVDVPYPDKDQAGVWVFKKGSFNTLQLLDLKMGFHYIPFTAIYFGKYVPQFSFFLPRSSTNLLLINYPMYTGWFGETAQEWRHTGLSFDVSTHWLEAEFGVWNGFTGQDLDNDKFGFAEIVTGANFTDDTNTGKDLNLMIEAKPLDGLRIRGNVWYGQPVAYYEDQNGDLKEYDNDLLLYGGGLFYQADFGLIAASEFFMKNITFREHEIDKGDGTTTTVPSTTINSMSYYVLAGFNLKHLAGIPLDLLGRYDFMDPDTRNSKEKGGYKDELTDITAGINYYLAGPHAVLSLDYIYHAENAKMLNKKADRYQTGISNDEIKFQAQVAF